MNLPRTKLFTGSVMGPSEPPMQYVRLKKEGIGMWIKGQVTEAFPPEGERRSPWDVSLTGVGQPNQNGTYNSYEGTVSPGLIGGILPSNWQTKFSVGSGVRYMVVDCQSNGKVVTAASITSASSPPQQQSPTLNTAPSSFGVCFGVVKDGEFVRTVRDGHISVNPIITFSINTSSPTPGLNVVDRYYVWGVL